jgi:RNA polymerase sigma factor (TIGR02999 family)
VPDSDLYSTPSPSKQDATAKGESQANALLIELRKQSESEQEVFASLQYELRRIARAKMRFERPDHTLQPTALVNEAFIKLFKSSSIPHLANDYSALRLIARVMEQVLKDYADAHKAAKRGGGQQRRVFIDDQQGQELPAGDALVPISPSLVVNPVQSEDILVVRDAINALAETSPRQAEVIRLQYYGGLTQEEIAAALDVSIETVKLDWRKAKAFLKAYISTTTP